ncbi:MAG: hypothetical protein D6734_08270 [Candidatus Schekmanbacteria bacterium]|nr:MAG: hypothetical protein D6734_08270 [Candidatus Schekmanbacteria bacterium]
MNNKDIYIDKSIPIEKQFKYLRDKFSFQAVRTFKFFKKKFGKEAEKMYEELYEMYMEDTLRDYNIDPKNLPFEVVAALAANEEDKSLGFAPEVVFKSDNEVHSKLSYCPYNEAANALKFDEPVCKFVCELNSKYMTENTSYEMKLTKRIANGDEFCLMKISKK